MLKASRYIVFGLSAFALVRCAQIMPLTGGQRDTTPPKLIEAVPAQQTVSFNTDEIILRFDEYVQVKDLNNQLIITPKLKNTPEITAEGKKVVVKFKKEELSPNTTYRFSFGNAIADMNESNSIPGFDYVFSTGSSVDTLKISGNIQEAFNNSPAPDVIVALYSGKDVSDSIIYKESPEYYTRTNEGGQFMLKNLPKTSFKLYAFTDKNKNGTYDGETEKAAFYGKILNLESDTTIPLRLFQEESPRTFIKRNASPYYGFSQLYLNKKTKVRLATIPSELGAMILETDIGKEKDTVSIFYRDITDSLKLTVQLQGSGKTDTVKLKLPRYTTAKKKLKAIQSNVSGSVLPLGGRIQFRFSTWMDTSYKDLSRMKLSSKQDSLVSLKPLTGRWKSVNLYEFGNELKEGVDYTLKVDTGAFYDLKHLSNDSAKFNFRTQAHSDLGKLTLKLLVNLKQDYVLQLINEGGAVIREHAFSFSLSSPNAVTVDFTDLAPGMYQARLIFDTNGNKKWDSGDLIRQQQPERIIIHSKQLKVVSDWEVEEEIQFKD